jgi:hypothetical protein
MPPTPAKIERVPLLLPLPLLLLLLPSRTPLSWTATEEASERKPEEPCVRKKIPSR